jgi:pimeloyl-[acyl-carrier protein] methyl ester esterase
METKNVLVLTGWAAGEPFFRELFDDSPFSPTYVSWDSARSPDDFPRIAKEAADSMPAGKFILLGWSLGAMVAVESAESLAERLEALWLIAPCLRFTDGWSAKVLASMKKRLLTDRASLLRDFASGFLALPETAYFQPSLLPVSTGTPMESLAAGLDYLAERDLTGPEIELTCPVSIVHGDADTVIPLALSFPVAERFRTPRSILFGAGHAPQLTRAKEIGGALFTGYME